jgi:hypothetical protein
MLDSTPSRARKTNRRRAGPAEVSPGISVGGWKDAERFEGSRFCVLDEVPADVPPSTHIAIYDENRDRAIVENLDRLARAIADEHAKGRPVLVFCGHGIRRGPLAAAWYLHRSEGLTLAEAYTRIRAVRPQIEEAKEWIGDPENLEGA